MNNQPSTIQQTFGATVLGVGAVANQGSFQQCTFLPSLTPEILAQLQQVFSAQTDTRNPDRIFRSVAQLGFLNKHERVTLDGLDARRVLDNIGNVLQALSPPSASSHILDRKATQEHDTNQGDNSGRHNALSAIRKILCASEHVGVNQPDVTRRQVSRESTSTVLARVEDTFDIAHAQVRVYAWKRRLLPNRAGKSTCDEFTVRIDVQPKLEGAPDGMPCISIYLQQIRGVDRFSFVDPMIVAHRTVPDSSPVFRMIKDGDSGGFMRLLQNGQASLWDCDSRGCSLINEYANHHCQPDICKYLIENGADVDCIEPEPYDANNSWLLPLLSHHFFQLDSTNYPTLNIFRYLLEAGADPTLGDDSSLLSLSLSVPEWPYKEETINLILKFGHEYVDTKAYDTIGCTMLLRYCMYAADRPKSMHEGIHSLIALGSTLDERDWSGNTCLHLIWPLSLRGDRSRVSLFMLVYHLLDLGADANARTKFDATPSDVVASRGIMVFYKIWDLALYIKGIKVDEWEVKKQRFHERDGIDFQISPLPGRNDRMSEHDWLESVWSEAAGWVSAGQKGTESGGTESNRLEAEVEEAEVEEAEVEEAKVEEAEVEEVEIEKEEETELDEAESKKGSLTPKQPSSILYTLWDFW